MSGRLRAFALAWSIAAGACTASAQDFAGPRAPLEPAGAAALLDAGLADPLAVASCEAGQATWWNTSDLRTRSLAAVLAWRSLRLAAGGSQTGEPELGWQSGALALGAADRDAGLAMRALARRDLANGAPGTEAGGGAWVRLADGLRLVASAPQLWTRGASPPLVRPMTAGLATDGGLASAWLAVEAPRAGAAGERLLGAAVDAGPARVWAEARGAPWRAALGVRVGAGRLHVSARVESHPALGETVMLALALRHSPEVR